MYGYTYMPTLASVHTAMIIIVDTLIRLPSGIRDCVVTRNEKDTIAVHTIQYVKLYVA